MRRLLIAVLALSIAAPAVAADRDDRRETDRVVRQLSDPRIARELGDTLGALVDAMMDIRIGRLAAVLNGDRNPGRAESERTIGDLASRDDPYFRDRTRAEVRTMTTGTGAAMRAMAVAIPELMRTADQIERDIARIAHSIPLPRD